MWSLIKRFIADDEKGSSLVEFALAGVFVAWSLITLIDVASALNNFTKLSNGMRAGQQYALKYPSDNSGIAQAIASASTLPSNDVSVTTSESCEWGGVSGSCNGSGTGEFAKYLSITASYSMSGRYVYTNSFYPQTLTKTIAVRVQ